MPIFQLRINVESFVGHPYWPERERLINIIKESGMSRARSTPNRNKALEQHLITQGMTLAEYEELERLASRSFYTDADDRVLIPKHVVDGMLTAACDTIRSAGRPCPPDMVRVVLRSSPWHSDRSPDEALIWERYVVVSTGTGAKLSNQRALRRNSYLGAQPPGEVPATPAMTCTGTLDLDPEMVKPAVAEQMLRWAGQNVGIGASRKMGWGRFKVLEFSEL